MRKLWKKVAYAAMTMAIAIGTVTMTTNKVEAKKYTYYSNVETVSYRLDYTGDTPVLKKASKNKTTLDKKGRVKKSEYLDYYNYESGGYSDTASQKNSTTYSYKGDLCVKQKSNDGSYTTYAYNKNRNYTTIKEYGSNGKISATTKYKYGNGDLCLSIKKCNAKGKLIYEEKNTYSKKNILIKSKTKHSDGWSSETLYNSKGMITSDKSFNAQGKLISETTYDSKGYTKERKEYSYEDGKKKINRKYVYTYKFAKKYVRSQVITKEYNAAGELEYTNISDYNTSGYKSGWIKKETHKDAYNENVTTYKYKADGTGKNVGTQEEINSEGQVVRKTVYKYKKITVNN